MNTDTLLAQAILDLAASRGTDKSICPSEVARTLWPDDWRVRMDEVRAEAFRLRDVGRVCVTQGGEDVTGNDPTGPIRITIA